MPAKNGRTESVSYLKLSFCSSLKTNFPFTEQSDAPNFTVAARLQEKSGAIKLPFTKSAATGKSPPMNVFKSATTPQLGLSKSPSMMAPTMMSAVTPTSTISPPLPGMGRNERAGSLLKRSLSVPGEGDSDSDVGGNGSGGDLKSKAENNENRKPENGFTGSKVAIPRFDDDETFSKFFSSRVRETVIEEQVEVGDFDEIKVATEKLASHKKAIQGPKGRRAARNPLKTLAQRQDLQSEYTEIKTGLAEKELKRIKLEQSKYLF